MQWEVWLIALLILVGVFVGSAIAVRSFASRMIPAPLPPAVEDQRTLRMIEHQRRDQHAQALYQLEAQAAQSGWTDDLARQAGDIWHELGDWQQALAYWGRINDPSADQLRRMADTALQQGEWVQAADWLADLLVHSPQDRWGNYQAGILWAAYDPRRAITHLEVIQRDLTYGEAAQRLLAVLSNEPHDLLIGMKVGTTLVDLELWSMAELAFRHTAVIAYPLPEALAYTGLARFRQGKDGAEWIQQAVELDPGNPQVRYLQALGFRAREDYERSLSVLLLAVTLAPDNPAIQAEVGTAYRLLGDMQRAEYWLQAAAQTAENEPAFTDLVSRFYAEEARFFPPDVLAMLAETVDQQPEDPDVLASYGWALHSNGQTDAGLTQLNTALALHPDHPQALYNKARILLEIDALAEARPLLEQLSQQDTAYQSEAVRILENLNG